MINNKRKITLIVYSTIASLIFLTFPAVCYAIEWKDVVDFIFGGLASLLVSAMGAVATLVISSIISIAKYNNFVNQEEIKTAWAIIRDISNMFFILILLLIAFATILRIETYNMKRWLPKLLIMAVLINFSKTICGIMIDFSQVIMLTFVNTFATNGGSFVATMQMDSFITNVRSAQTEMISTGEATKAYVLAVVFMLIAIITLTAILIVFLMRLIMLWVLVTLSPLAFMLSTFPQGQRYASQYWGEFSKYLVNGPVLAFFIWLALSVSGNIDANSITNDTSVQGLKTGVVGILSLENFLSFILAIGFLVGGLMISQQIGGVGASWGSSTVRNLGNKGLNMTKRAAMAPLKATGAVAKFGGSWGLDKLSLAAGVDLNVPRVIDRVKSQMRRQKENRVDQIYDKAVETSNSVKAGRVRATLAFASTGDLAWKNISDWEGAKKAGKRMIKGNKWYDNSDKIKELKKERVEIWSKEEKDSHAKRLQDKVDQRNKHLTETPDYLIKRKYEELDEVIERQRTNPPSSVKEQIDLDNKEKSLMNEIQNMEKNKEKLKEEHSEIGEKMGREVAMIRDEATNKKYAPERAQEIDEKLKDYQGRIEKYRYDGSEEIEGASDSRGEAEARRAIGSIDNTDKLLNMMQEAIQKGNQPLVRALAKKVTKNGDLNDLMRRFNFGTTLQDFHKLSSFLQKNGGFSEQRSLSLLAELGGIAKNMGQYYAHGNVKMENGRWVEATQDEKDEAWTSEIMNVQPQKGARDLGRLAYIEYTNGDHSDYRIARPGILYIKQNGESFGENMAKTGNQKAATFLAGKAEQLYDNDVDKTTIEQIEKRGKDTETDYGRAVKSIKL